MRLLCLTPPTRLSAAIGSLIDVSSEMACAGM
jgi:hypothetical protein